MNNFTDVLFLDTEDFSTEDIKNGSYKYSEGVEVLLIAYSFNFEPVQVVDLTIWQRQRLTPAQIWKKLPERLRAGLLDPKVRKQAFNIAFDRTQLNAYFNIYIPVDQCWCTLAHAGMAGFPMKLETCAKAMKLPQEKNAEGKKLIRLFCIPDKKGNRTRAWELPDKWAEFIEYNRQDVVVEMEIFKNISWYVVSPLEYEIWCAVERKNERGVMVDMEFIDSAIYLNTYYRNKLIKEAIELTGLSNPNSRNQIKKWLEDELEMDTIKSLDKNAVNKMILEVDNEKALKVLSIRKQISKSSITKYAAMRRQASSKDHRIRGMFQFYGAQKSSRESGRLSQPQNYPRIEDWFADYVDNAREVVRDRDIEMLDICFDNVPHVLSQLLRTAFVAAPGKELAVLDFKAVEAVILSYLADEKWRNNFFKKGGDIYIASGSVMFKIPPEQVTKDIRQKSKISELLCQYGGTKTAMIKNNDTIEDPKKRIPKKEMKGIVEAWRKANSNIVKLWWKTGEAAVETVKTGKRHDVIKGIYFYMKGDNLQMMMPSGKSISYVNAHLLNYWIATVKQKAEGEFDDKGNPVYENIRIKLGLVNTGDMSEFYALMRDKRIKQVEGIEPKQSESLAYWGMDEGQWREIETYGPKLVQNFVESWGRDLLMHSILNFEKKGMPCILSVHDEGVFEIDKDSSTFEEMKKLMIIKPKWSEDMFLNADGFIGDYYQK